MKAKLICIALCVLFQFSGNAQTSTGNLVGTWSGTVHGEPMTLTFFHNGLASWQLGTMFNMGKGQLTFNGETQKGSLLFEVEAQQDLLTIDLIMYNPSSGSRFGFPCLAKFTDQNTLQFVVGKFKGERPKDLQNRIILTRKLGLQNE